MVAKAKDAPWPKEPLEQAKKLIQGSVVEAEDPQDFMIRSVLAVRVFEEDLEAPFSRTRLKMFSGANNC